MTKEYIIGACSGKEIIVKKEQIITVTDIEGGQVVDFCPRALPLIATNRYGYLSEITFTLIYIILYCKLFMTTWANTTYFTPVAVPKCTNFFIKTVKIIKIV